MQVDWTVLQHRNLSEIVLEEDEHLESIECDENMFDNSSTANVIYYLL